MVDLSIWLKVWTTKRSFAITRLSVTSHPTLVSDVAQWTRPLWMSGARASGESPRYCISKNKYHVEKGHGPWGVNMNIAKWTFNTDYTIEIGKLVGHPSEHGLDDIQTPKNNHTTRSCIPCPMRLAVQITTDWDTWRENDNMWDELE